MKWSIAWASAAGWLKRAVQIGVLLLVLTLLLPQQRSAAAVARAQQTTQHISLYLIIDSSGSMNTADSRNVRWAEVRLLASLLNAGDELVVLSFNSDNPDTSRKESAVSFFTGGSGANKYGPLIRIDEAVDKATLLRDLDQFATANPPRNNTDMLAAFQAVTPLVQQARSDSQAYIIFLTDGIPSRSGPTYDQDLLKQVKLLDKPLYAGGLWRDQNCNALSGEAAQGHSLLRSLVSQAPAGQVACIDKAESLSTFFLQSFGQIANRQFLRPDQRRFFEIADDQAGIVQSMTLIYVEDNLGCRDRVRAELCVQIKPPNGAPLSTDQLRTRKIEVTRDNDFMVVTIPNPEAGSWQIGDDPANAYGILQTTLGMEINSVRIGSTRHPLGQPLPVAVRLFRTQEDGTKQPLDDRYSPTFAVQTLQFEERTSAAPQTFSLTYDPSKGLYTSLIPSPQQIGHYNITITAEVGGFRLTQNHRVSVELFPQLQVRGLPDTNLLHAPRGQAARLELAPELNQQTAPVEGLQAGSFVLRCDGQQIPTRLESKQDGTYVLVFTPLQQPASQCTLEAEAHVSYIGTTYPFRAGPFNFAVTLQPQIKLETTSSEDLGVVLPFDSLSLTGTNALLLSDKPVELQAQLGNDAPLAVSVSPRNLLPNERTPLVFTLTPRDGTALAYGPYEGVILLNLPDGVDIDGPSALRYHFDLRQPSITHNIPPTGYHLSAAISGYDDAAMIDIRLDPHLPAEQQVRLELLDDQDQPLKGISANPATLTVPATASQTYQIHLQRDGGADPWPASWVRDRPIQFKVRLVVGGDTQVLPSPVIDVSGSRRWIPGMLWETYHLGLWLTLAMLGFVVSYTGATVGWLIGHRSPATWSAKEYLVPVQYEDGRFATSESMKVPLSKFNRLRHRLFGVRARHGNPSNRARPRFSLFKASTFWALLLRVGHSDLKTPFTSAAAYDFSLGIEGHAKKNRRYWVKNNTTSPLTAISPHGMTSQITRNVQVLEHGSMILVDGRYGYRIDNGGREPATDRPHIRRLGAGQPSEIGGTSLPATDSRSSTATPKPSITPDSADTSSHTSRPTTSGHGETTADSHAPPRHPDSPQRRVKP